MAHKPYEFGNRPVAGSDIEHDVASGTRALVIGPYLTRRRANNPDANLRPAMARLEEATGLAAAIDLDVVESRIVPLSELRPATYIGTGKIEELAALIAERDIRLVITDCALSPVQQRNLETALKVKVIDRTGLILEIFGRRARTKEGTLQVELAHLNYQKSRLVRSWTHLERQRGGFGFLGGPGETQIEADRRLIQERMTRIERDLEAVKRTRGLHRKSREKVPYPVVALVGYTNAGKSTLFNRLTEAEVLAENMLFATLDPTARVTKLPHGASVILSDTVGFISDLPTMLVAAFRATLEDVISADVILHVRDVSHGDTDAQAADVTSILKDLGINPDDHKRIIEVWNKADLLNDDERSRMFEMTQQRSAAARPVLVSALTGEGTDNLLNEIETRLAQDTKTFRIILPVDEGAVLHWLYENAEILERHDRDEGVIETLVRVTPERESRLLLRCPRAKRVV